MTDLLALLDALPPGEAIFDLDGTLIQHDIGEAVLRRRIAAGALPPSAVAILGEADPWAAYVALDPVAQCEAAALALAGLDRAAVEQLVDAAFAEGDVAPAHAVCTLAAAIGRRHDVWIVTGSAEILGVLAGLRLGIRNVVGVRLPWRDGRLGETIAGTVSCAEGKVRVVQDTFGRPPVFAIGDSPWDLPLLRTARIARTTGRIAGEGFPAFP